MKVYIKDCLIDFASFPDKMEYLLNHFEKHGGDDHYVHFRGYNYEEADYVGSVIEKMGVEYNRVPTKDKSVFYATFKKEDFSLLCLLSDPKCTWCMNAGRLIFRDRK